VGAVKLPLDSVFAELLRLRLLPVLIPIF